MEFISAYVTGILSYFLSTYSYQGPIKIRQHYLKQYPLKYFFVGYVTGINIDPVENSEY